MIALLSLWFYRARASALVSDYLLDIVNFALMVISVLGYSEGRYKTQSNGEQQSNFSVDMSEFPYECKFSLPPAEIKLSNFYGAFVTHEKIFNIIELAIIQSARGEEQLLSLLCAGGDTNTPRLLKQYMAVLLANEKNKNVEMTEFVENPMPEATRRSLSENMTMQHGLRLSFNSRERLETESQSEISGLAADTERIKAEITRIYQVCNPSMLQELPNLFERYPGKEQTLLDMIKQKYAAQLNGRAAAAIVPSAPGFHQEDYAQQPGFNTMLVQPGPAFSSIAPLAIEAPHQGYSQRFSFKPTLVQPGPAFSAAAPLTPEATRISSRLQAGGVLSPPAALVPTFPIAAKTISAQQLNEQHAVLMQQREIVLQAQQRIFTPGGQYRGEEL
jgi:hypothetical protein